MALTDTIIRNAKPAPGKAYKLADEKGMFLLLQPNGSKYFRLITRQTLTPDFICMLLN